MHKLEYSNRFCSLLIEEPSFCIWLVANIIGKNEDVKNYLVKYRSRLIHCHCRKYFLYCDLDRSNLFTLLMKSSSSETGLRRSEKYTLCQWPINNDHYQMIIKWSHSCTLKQFSHFLIVGFLCFLGIQSSTSLMFPRRCWTRSEEHHGEKNKKRLICIWPSLCSHLSLRHKNTGRNSVIWALQVFFRF